MHKKQNICAFVNMQYVQLQKPKPVNSFNFETWIDNAMPHFMISDNGSNIEKCI